jgi:hypothetical protein
MRTEAEISAAATDGSPFSNGTEGYAWMDNWCGRCLNNDEETELWCPILTVALFGKTPSEWLEQPWGQVKGRPEGMTAPSLGDRVIRDAVTKKAIDSDTLAELFEYDDGEKSGDWARVAVQHIDTARWYEHYYLVITDEPDVFWGAHYSEGLTENQDNDYPWEDRDSVSLVRLYPHEVTRMEYRSKPAEVPA